MMQTLLNTRLNLKAILILSLVALASCTTFQPKGQFGAWTNAKGEEVQLVKATNFRDRARPASELAGPKAYLLRPGDVVALRVEHLTPIDLPALRVDDEGLLDLPLLGCIETRGFSLDHVRRELRARYAKIFTAAKVTLRLVKRHRATCSVLGQVGQPGLMDIDEKTTVVKAIAMAGGFRYLNRRDALGSSDLSRTFLSRSGGLVQIDFEALFLEGDLKQDVTIQDGDLIFVPDRSHREVVVLGAVGKPGIVPMPTGDLNVLSAIGHAGGFSDLADISLVAVIRNVETNPAVRLVNTELLLSAGESAFKLENGDVLFVARDDIRALDIPGMVKTATSGLVLAYGVTSFQQ